jgi:hypothetical protein
VTHSALQKWKYFCSRGFGSCDALLVSRSGTFLRVSGLLLLATVTGTSGVSVADHGPTILHGTITTKSIENSITGDEPGSEYPLLDSQCGN